MADAGRVIAGSAKGVRLAAPGAGTRPFTDRVKQTLFAILEPELEGANVLDLFAGSGAGGIEALSRGAARATFVEHDAGAARVIAENLRRAKLEARSRVTRRDAIAWLTSPEGAAIDGPFDLVLVDPPYTDMAALARALELVEPHVSPGGRVIAKHFWRDAPPAVVGLLASERERRFGETALTFYRRRADPATATRVEEEAGKA
ncbi:MAG: 16S rRNA (guanine(966)-N(2))-methyltransferase RsmD [Chloroflexi bacterium RBG_16_72_14]|nr:MAG: 16S rRNA (guanine(966)-N(2))-methyltransferase RsmD [Chloroflexi bacterium RBG_16_72_14]